MAPSIVYDALVSAIDDACKHQLFDSVCEAALNLGMTGGRVEAFNSLKYEYQYRDNTEKEVALSVRSYDPSGPFQNEPDINRFTVKLFENGREIAAYDRQYSE